MEVSWSNIVATVATIVAIITLLFSFFVEKEKTSKLYTEIVTRLRVISSRLGGLPRVSVRILQTYLTLVFGGFLLIYIMSVPVILYGEIGKPSLALTPDSNWTMIYPNLIIVVWCLSVATLSQVITINRLRKQIDYLNRIPGIKELKDKYDTQLFDAAMQEWDDFMAELISKHDNSPFALDIAACSLVDVKYETLIIEVPNRVIYKRLHPKQNSSSMDDSLYQEIMSDKQTIERLIKSRFKVMEISYTLKKQPKQ